jgi:hypothetical protein
MICGWRTSASLTSARPLGAPEAQITPPVALGNPSRKSECHTYTFHNLRGVKRFSLRSDFFTRIDRIRFSLGWVPCLRLRKHLSERQEDGASKDWRRTPSPLTENPLCGGSACLRERRHGTRLSSASIGVHLRLEEWWAQPTLPALAIAVPTRVPCGSERWVVDLGWGER